MAKLTSILLILLTFQAAFGAESNSSSKKVKRKESVKESKKWSLILNNTTESNLYKPGSLSHTAQNQMAVLLAYEFDALTLRGLVAGTKDLTGERELKIADSSIQALHTITEFTRWLTLSGKHALTIPLSEKSKKYSKLKTAISLSSTLSWDMSQYERNGSKIDYKVFGGKYFHEFKFQPTGKRNQSHYFGHELTYSFEFNKTVSTSIGGTYTRYIDYFGNSTDTYAIEETLNFKLPKSSILTLGHYTGGSPLKADKRSTNIDVISPRNATVYLSLTFLL